MFKVGDRVICIENREGQHDLILYKKVYIIECVYSILDTEYLSLIGIPYYTYVFDRFGSIKKERKEKLNKICSL